MTAPYEFTDKAAGYRRLAGDLQALLAAEHDLIANAANTAALLFGALPEVNWAGFYFLRDGALRRRPVPGQARVRAHRAGTGRVRHGSRRAAHARRGRRTPVPRTHRLRRRLARGDRGAAAARPRAARRARPRQSAARALRRAPMPPGSKRSRAVFMAASARGRARAHEGAPVAARAGRRRRGLHHLGAVSDLPASAARGAGAADHRSPYQLVMPLHPRVDAAARRAAAPRRHLLPAGAAGAAAAECAAHLRQLAGVRLGRVPRPHRRHQPRLLHQPAGERGARECSCCTSG